MRWRTLEGQGTTLLVLVGRGSSAADWLAGASLPGSTRVPTAPDLHGASFTLGDTSCYKSVPEQTPLLWKWPGPGAAGTLPFRGPRLCPGAQGEGAGP